MAMSYRPAPPASTPRSETQNQSQALCTAPVRTQLSPITESRTPSPACIFKVPTSFGLSYKAFEVSFTADSILWNYPSIVCILADGGSEDNRTFENMPALANAVLHRYIRDLAWVVAFLSYQQTQGDELLYDAAIHASVHNGARTSRLHRSFADDDVCALRAVCPALKKGESSIFVAAEGVYSMDGTVALLRAILDAMDQVFPAGNVHLVVDEAHTTRIYGPGGHGIVALLGLEDRVLALSEYPYLYPGRYPISAKPLCTRTLTLTPLAGHEFSRVRVRIGNVYPRVTPDERDEP
ncbi:hypothetical protein BC826DRAFT_1187184 [Russula brevipes]|nr:hypothetical protein BC826DRAFT_1187184 [Russula brevipes]